MENPIYITPQLLKSDIAKSIDLNSPYYLSLFSETGLIGGFTVEEFAFKRYLRSVLKLSLQLNKLDINNLNQEAINDAIFRLEVAALTQIDKDNMTMTFSPKNFVNDKEALKVLQVLTPSVIQYVALKHGLKVEDGLGFFLNNSSIGTKRLVPCEKVNDKDMIKSISQKLKVDYTKLVPTENTEPSKTSSKTNNKDN